MDKSIKILIAEDDYLICEEIKRLLKTIRYTNLLTARNGKEAIELTKQEKPDVILMDINMPVQDGLEASKIIFEACPTPIVMLTAYGGTDLVKQASLNGVGAYITKPPKADELERAIMISIARHSDLTDLRQFNDELEATIKELKTLQGIIPICSNCKKIRIDNSSWQQIEEYISEHSNATFSHGICKSCTTTLYPEYTKLDKHY